MNAGNWHRLSTGEITAYLRELLPDANISVSDKPVAMTSLVKTDRLRTELDFTPSTRSRTASWPI